MSLWPQPNRPIITPCIGVCALDKQDLCEGCLRTGVEISRWASMSDAERRHIMDVVLPEREANRHAV